MSLICYHVLCLPSPIPFRLPRTDILSEPRREPRSTLKKRENRAPKLQHLQQDTNASFRKSLGITHMQTAGGYRANLSTGCLSHGALPGRARVPRRHWLRAGWPSAIRTQGSKGQRQSSRSSPTSVPALRIWENCLRLYPTTASEAPKSWFTRRNDAKFRTFSGAWYYVLVR